MADFVSTAKRGNQTPTDKVTSHMYQTVYGAQLCATTPQKGAEAASLWQTPKKFLEIGLGCDMQYGPGASVRLWASLFPTIKERWEAEFDEKCVVSSQARGQLEGVNVLVGDQGNPSTLAQWRTKAGGNFDVIIDDGGHKNKQIALTFAALWPDLAPGGIYFIEDIQLGRVGRYEDTFSRAVTADWLAVLAAELILGREAVAAMPSEPSKCTEEKARPGCLSVRGGRRRANMTLFRPPDVDEVEYVFCSLEACSMGKSRRG